jgi:hypothetical protein
LGRMIFLVFGVSLCWLPAAWWNLQRWLSQFWHQFHLLQAVFSKYVLFKMKVWLVRLFELKLLWWACCFEMAGMIGVFFEWNCWFLASVDCRCVSRGGISNNFELVSKVQPA